MKKMKQLCTGIILAGGKSRRFGRDKTTLKIDGKLLVEKQVEILRPIVNEIIIVSNAYCKFHLIDTLEVTDWYKNIGPMGGIHAGLSHASYEKCVVLACDMPFVCRDFVKSLLHRLEQEKSSEMVIPVSKKGVEPLCGIYRKGNLLLLEESIKKGERKLSAWLEEKYKEGYVTYVKVKEEEQCYFYNINTQEDYINIV